MKPLFIAAMSFGAGVALAAAGLAWVPVLRQDCAVEVTRQVPAVVKYSTRGKLGKIELRPEVTEWTGTQRISVRHGYVCELRIGRGA